MESLIGRKSDMSCWALPKQPKMMRESLRRVSGVLQLYKAEMEGGGEVDEAAKDRSLGLGDFWNVDFQEEL